jgi:Family of unknown function (DUF5329)
MIRFLLVTFGFVLSVELATTQLVLAEPISSGEKQKIEILIKRVSEMSDAQFVRNDSAYDAKTAAVFLRRKWKANDSEVKTAQDFVDKIATLSGTSGKPYVIRFKDGREVKSRDILLAELNKIEAGS